MYVKDYKILLLQCDPPPKKKHTLRQNYNNVLIFTLLHISGLTSTSPGTAQLYHSTLLSRSVCRIVPRSSMYDCRAGNVQLLEHPVGFSVS
jgi:hypothetical protein